DRLAEVEPAKFESGTLARWHDPKRCGPAEAIARLGVEPGSLQLRVCDDHQVLSGDGAEIDLELGCAIRRQRRRSATREFHFRREVIRELDRERPGLLPLELRTEGHVTAGHGPSSDRLQPQYRRSFGAVAEWALAWVREMHQRVRCCVHRR